VLANPVDHMVYSALLPEVVGGVLDPRHVASPRTRSGHGSQRDKHKPVAPAPSTAAKLYQRTALVRNHVARG
jgi:hypothetical protein